MAHPPNTELEPHPHETPFSLAPSIFTTFSRLSSESQPTTPEGNLDKILQNMGTQHEAVRRQMIGSLQAKGKDLVRQAEEDLARLDDDAQEDSMEEEFRGIEARKSREEMMNRVRFKMRQGTKPGDYEIKPGRLEFRDAIAAPGAGNGDLEISGMDHPRSATTIRQGLSIKLRDLVDRGIVELEAYDAHAAEPTSMYKQSLKRREERRRSTSNTAFQAPVAKSSTTDGAGSGLP